MITSTDTITLRPLGPADAATVADLHAGMPDKDGLFRNLMPHPTELPNVARALALRDRAHCVLGAFADDRIVGLGNFVVLGTTKTAEVAIVIDPDQDDRTGAFGLELLRRLVHLARERGIERFVTELIPANTRMMRLVADTEFTVTAYRQNGIARVGIQL
ncbi:GNAT family N-acetyltransferase [Nocardia vinacea]|uniref:GNAT family N-acetyltransferase n=1 Tax=Nocardia vinacea TaxID=96468 RepID=UPI002E15DE57|nr:GNAT family N-acetyltransferase [Nocardia vinacea]